MRKKLKIMASLDSMVKKGKFSFSRLLPMRLKMSADLKEKIYQRKKELCYPK